MTTDFTVICDGSDIDEATIEAALVALVRQFVKSRRLSSTYRIASLRRTVVIEISNPWAPKRMSWH